jgi:1-acyl-sn-glycerol-3-phosphate acyltransferase
MYYFAGYLTKFILSIFGRLKVHQKENLPDSGGYVIACTHTGWVDILLLGHSILPLKIHYMAKIELFQNRPLKWLMEKLNAFPVNRENPGPSAIKTPRKLIKEGEIVGIFPSGTRTSEDAPLKRGAVTIIGQSKAPIVPAAYVGPNNFKDLLKFKKPHVIFGEPIYAREDKSRREAADIMMDQLNEALKTLQAEIEYKK